MTYATGYLTQLADGNGFGTYRLDTLDTPVTVETAGYFNNVDDNLRLARGDLITLVTWATAVRSGTISRVSQFIVTNVIANDAAASAGNVNVAEYGIATTGAISSGN